MSTEAMLAMAYKSYRARLEVMLDISPCATDHDIRAMIATGLPTSSLESFREYYSADLLEHLGFVSSKMIKANQTLSQRLNENGGAHLVRIAKIVALADVFFGDEAKAKRWLTTPKKHFSGEMPIAMLSTIQGTQRVEEMIIQAAEGITF